MKITKFNKSAVEMIADIEKNNEKNISLELEEIADTKEIATFFDLCTEKKIKIELFTYPLLFDARNDDDLLLVKSITRNGIEFRSVKFYENR